ncbi:Glycerol kinase [compost metagenome]
MQQDAEEELRTLRVDGGVTANNFLMQFQADILATPVERPTMKETTALGAAFLAGLATGFWQDLNELRNKSAIEKVFEPRTSLEETEVMYKGWLKAVQRSQNWAED